MSEWNSGGWSSQSGSGGGNGWSSGSAQSGGQPWGSPAAQNNFGSGTSSWSTQKKPEEPKTEYVFSPPKLIAGLVGGAAGGVTAWYWLDGLRTGNGWSPLSFAAAMTLIAVCIAAAIRIAAGVDGSAKHLRRTEPKAHFGRRCLAWILVLFLVSGLFEWLYELGGTAAVVQPTSYIFALDTSGSMDDGTGDAMQKAAEDVIASLEPGFPFSVYTFSSDVQMIAPMHGKTAAENQPALSLAFVGTTALYGALDQICSDYEAETAVGTWAGGSSPKVLLFSDGIPTDSGVLSASSGAALKRLRQNGLTVSTLSVDGADLELMKEIADQTGGVALHIRDTADLRAAMERALTESADRTLFSVRPVMVHGWLYVLMRLIFLTILGAMFAPVIWYAGCLRDDRFRAVFLKVPTGIIGAAFAEIGTQSFGLPEQVICTGFGVLAGFVLLHAVYVKPEKQQKPQFTGSGWTGGSTQPDMERREIQDKNAGGGLW